MIDAKTVEELRGLLGEAPHEIWTAERTGDGRLFIATPGDVVAHVDPNHSDPNDAFDTQNFALIVAMRNALPDLLGAAERLERQVRAKQQEIEEIAARAQENYERALAAERLASRAREDVLREGFLAGFLASGEGFNGEYPFDHDRAAIEANEGIAERILALIDKPKGADRG